MASSIQETKKLKDLSDKEAAILLGKIKFKAISNTLLSGEYGKITGEVLEELDDKNLQSIGINISFQRKQFLKSITKYKSKGVSIDLLRSDETLTKQSFETDQIAVDDKHTLSIDDKAKLHALIQNSEKVSKECISEMDIYAFPIKKVQVKDLQQPLFGTNLKKIIIMGETGSGKSTLINAIINYAVGVEMEDPFRFKLVVDEDERGNDQTVSQTSEISGYYIKDTLLEFSIQIWDTPGFGDTRGIERDEEIKQQINELLKLEDLCHAVCFVVKASVNRLTEIQKYIIDRVLLFFGKEAQENIYVLVTYADDSRPDVLQALEKCNNFPFDEDRWFAFNNGSLFKPASERKRFSKIYWEITNDNLDRLFNKIGEVHPFSLTSTKEVIKQRENFKKNIDPIITEIEDTAHNTETFEDSIAFLESQKQSFEETGTFIDRKTIIETKCEPTYGKNTICKKCMSNCHIGCRKVGIVFCHKFNWNYICTECHCALIYHDKVRWKYEGVENICETVHKAGGAQYEQKILENKEQRDKGKSKLSVLIKRVHEQIRNINKAAMLGYSNSLLMYMKSFIKSEEEEAELFKEADEIRIFLNQEKLALTIPKHGDEIPRAIDKKDH